MCKDPARWQCVLRAHSKSFLDFIEGFHIIIDPTGERANKLETETKYPYPPEQEEISISDIIAVLFKHRILIFVIMTVSTFVAGLTSLFMKPIYEAKAVISPVTSSVSTTSLIAQQLGIATSQPPIVTDIVALLKSRVLRENVVKKYKLIPYFLENPASKEKTEEEIIWDILRTLEGTLKVKYQQRDNVIEVSFEHGDKEFSAKFIEYLLLSLNDHMVSEAKRVAETNKNYLLKEVEKTGDPYIRANIYSMIAQQIQQSMMAEAKENFAFKIIDPPKVPDKKAKPKRSLIVLLTFVVSMFFGFLLAFISENIEKRTGRSIEDWMAIKIKKGGKNG